MYLAVQIEKRPVNQTDRLFRFHIAQPVSRGATAKQQSQWNLLYDSCWRSSLGSHATHGANMFQGNGPHELGYANAAVLSALLRTLVREKILTQDMVEDVLRDGIKILQPTSMLDSVARAQNFIKNSLAAAVKKPSDEAA